MNDNLEALANMVYSGRGIIVGMTPNGNSFVGYSLTGRSPSSQARELVETESGIVRTSVTDEEQLRKGNPALLLYPAIIPVNSKAIIAGNGVQTELLYREVSKPPYSQIMLADIDIDPERFLIKSFSASEPRFDAKTDSWIDIASYEPDDPNFTPRINGLIIGIKACLNIICKDSSNRSDSKYFPMNLKPGEGHLITTYAGGNEDPLKPFEGKPLEVGIESTTPEDLVESIYDAIHEFRVSAAVSMFNPTTKTFDTKIINRSERGN